MLLIKNTDAIYYGIFSITDVIEDARNFSDNALASPSIIHTHVDWLNKSGTDLVTFQDPDPEMGLSVLELAARMEKKNSVLAVSWDPLAIDFLDPTIFDGSFSPQIGMQDILDGNHDAYIRQVAQQVAEYGGPILLNLFGESDAASLFGYGPNGNEFRDTTADQFGHYGDTASQDGTERTRDVFKHVIDIFNDEGANNVTWFQQSGSGYETNSGDVEPAAIYAGDEYIDWVGSSVYAIDPSGISEALDDSYAAWTNLTDKPYFVPELGLETTGVDHVERVMTQLATYDQITAATWTDFDGAEAYYGIMRLGNSPDDWVAMRQAVQSAREVIIETPNGPMTISAWRTESGRADEDRYIYGTAEADYLHGTEASDVFVGGSGDDIFMVNNPSDEIIETANDGYDIVMSTVTRRLENNVEALFLSGNGDLDVQGNSLENLILGNAGSNHLEGFGGNDTLLGESGDDIISGGEGDDYITGGSGADEIYGGSGVDYVEGDAGNDTLIGGNGQDVLVGGSGNDILRGGEDLDVLEGGDGDDILYLESGSDIATGGTGADTFVIRATGGMATIEDFDPNLDRLDISAYAVSEVSALAATAMQLETGVYLDLANYGGDQLFISGVEVSDLVSENLVF